MPLAVFAFFLSLFFLLFSSILDCCATFLMQNINQELKWPVQSVSRTHFGKIIWDRTHDKSFCMLLLVFLNNASFVEILAVGRHKTCVLSKVETGWQTSRLTIHMPILHHFRVRLVGWLDAFCRGDCFRGSYR